MDPSVIAALVAGSVSLVITIIGVSVTLLTTRQQMKVQHVELELKKQQIENAQKELAADIEGLRQSQYEQILAKRVEVYPKLWAIHITYETNWTIEAKPKNHEWAGKYLEALNEFNVNNGLFFSQDLYTMFHKLRTKLIEAKNSTAENENVSKELTQEISFLVYGKQNDYLGLSYYEKDDLGSYGAAKIQLRSNTSN